MMLTLSSSVAPEFVVMTIYAATSEDKVGIITIFSFQCKQQTLSTGIWQAIIFPSTDLLSMPPLEKNA